MALTSFIEEPKFDVYRERFAEHFILEREDGILVARMHTGGDVAVWGLELHRALGQLFKTVAADPENEVLILTGTGDYWLRDIDSESFNAVEKDESTFRREGYFQWYRDGMKLQENIIWDVDIPTISAINGPGFHSEFALLHDITICTDDTRLVEPHYHVGLAPGDALYLVLQELIGYKRANYAMYTAQNITAEQALEWGLVNEVVAREDLVDRARSLAEMIIRTQPNPIVRRLTSRIVKRRWRRLLTDDFEMHFGHEMWGTMVHRQDHGEMDTRAALNEG
ncbi:enoyl-CoA hydratase/isomerase family protein [Aeromicrobium phragmitis]|uniref:Enoyl-CoA hydratase/isomerase family protein n=1 Tax=Aeromicrobium phragmitis TaxID=2478914 RepID=A0A3L8PJX9_9ACTN|nr:enoyl-CoA hydratase/isomerase family protein [Aeromicrobium phragmitis]RLV55665.1 enoyl-CoA hydratase/isomerase family protein [Aeromicrobium phragmitis]